MSSNINLPLEISGAVVQVATFAALPPTASEPVGSERVTADDGTLYINTPGGWAAAGGGGGGGITSINGNGAASQTIAAGSGIGVASAGGTTTITNTAPAPTGSNNTFAGFDGAGALESIPGWGINSVSGADVNLSYQPNNLAQFFSIQNYSANIDPLQNSPNDSANALNMLLNIDPNSTGFTFGTGGVGANIFNLGFSHLGKSDTGSLNICNAYMNLGNGTDPINVRGISGYSVYGDLNSGVTLTGGLQGFTFSPQVHAGAVFSPGPSFTNVFADDANVQTSCDGWISFASNPQLLNMPNNRNYSAFSANPTITTMSGNSQAVMFYAGGSFPAGTGAGGGGYAALQVNPNFGVLNANSQMINVGGVSTTGTADWTGVSVNGGSINTSGNIRGAVINMANTQVAIDSQGHHNLNSGFQLISGQGQQYGNVIGGELKIDDGITPATVTGTDTLANNMAYSVNTGLAGSSWTAASVVGLTTLGFVGQITGAGTITGAINFCLSGYADAHTGHIDRVNNFHAAAIPTGAGGTMDESILFLGEAPFGAVATDNWGIRMESNLENYVDRFAVSTTSKKVTNASCGIELGGTTQAVLLSRLTTAEKLALTALDGMLVYDTDLAKFQGYEAGSWVNLV